MFHAVFESTLDFTTSLKSNTARLKYRSCAHVSGGSARRTNRFAIENKGEQCTGQGFENDAHGGRSLWTDHRPAFKEKTHV